jgi:hypothetical protein
MHNWYVEEVANRRMRYEREQAARARTLEEAAMETWSHFPARHAHYLELLAEAEQERHIRALLANRPRNAPFFAPALAWLGRQLVTWGVGLRARYDQAGH